MKQARQIVIRLDDQPNRHAETVGRDINYEPGLSWNNGKLLQQFPVPQWREDYLGHLARKIERNPRDLHSHTQRILMNFGSGRKDACYGALIDLFIALGNKGRALKQTLLHQVNELLESQQGQFLKSRLESGISPDEQLLNADFSRLSQGYSGCRDVVILIDEDDQRDHMTAPQVAQKKLEEGKVNEACRVLEQVLNTDPGDAEICHQLLNIYREHQLPQQFHSTYNRYASRKLGDPAAWRAAERYFANAQSN